MDRLTDRAHNNLKKCRRAVKHRHNSSIKIPLKICLVIMIFDGSKRRSNFQTLLITEKVCQNHIITIIQVLTNVVNFHHVRSIAQYARSSEISLRCIVLLIVLSSFVDTFQRLPIKRVILPYYFFLPDPFEMDIVPHFYL